jgi:hypothetical protein
MTTYTASEQRQLDQESGEALDKALLRQHGKIEQIAKAFCEASGAHKWQDTHGRHREWYLHGAQAIFDLKLK